MKGLFSILVAALVGIAILVAGNTAEAHNGFRVQSVGGHGHVQVQQFAVQPQRVVVQRVVPQHVVVQQVRPQRVFVQQAHGHQVAVQQVRQQRVVVQNVHPQRFSVQSAHSQPQVVIQNNQIQRRGILGRVFGR